MKPQQAADLEDVVSTCCIKYKTSHPVPAVDLVNIVLRELAIFSALR